MLGLMELGKPGFEEPHHRAVVRILPLFVEPSRIFEERLDVRPHQIRCRDDRLEQSRAVENCEFVYGLLFHGPLNRTKPGNRLPGQDRVEAIVRRIIILGHHRYFEFPSVIDTNSRNSALGPPDADLRGMILQFFAVVFPRRIETICARGVRQVADKDPLHVDESPRKPG